MTVTASQIKTIIDTALKAANIILRTYDYTTHAQRKVFPYVEIVIPTQSSEKNERIITYSQRFKLILAVRARGESLAEVQFQDTVEPVIRAALDGATLAGDRIFTENKNWTRAQQQVLKPVPHYESTLDVYVIDIQSTTGTGQIGARISVTLPGLANIPLLSMPQQPETMQSEDVYNDVKNRVTIAPHKHTRAVLFEIESNDSRRSSLRTLLQTRSYIPISIIRTTGTETLSKCLLTNIMDGAGYRDIETLIIKAEVVDLS